jgi:uncharacterized protein YndB with AHSA1/START domain
MALPIEDDAARGNGGEHGRTGVRRSVIGSQSEVSKMTTLQLTQVPVAKTGMLIRKPAAEVFAAFVEPAITTKFWFSKSSGGLEPGKRVEWQWEMFGTSTQLTVTALEPNRRIVIEWQGYSGPTTVEWVFTPMENGTFVTITESGFNGDGDALVKYVATSGQGFSWTLAGLKALLEHGIQLNLVPDRFPRGPRHPYPEE